MKSGLFKLLGGVIAAITFVFLADAGKIVETPDTNGCDLIWGLRIPMRDGIHLNGTVYKPKNSAPMPVIFTLSPYIADSDHDRGTYFAANGYVFVMVDARGRGNSEGTFTPFLQEAKDGHDVVEFLAKQPWCDGQVAMWGGSYQGYDQEATAKEFPPHLKTIVPTAAVFPGVDFPGWNNIIQSYEMQWLTDTSGRTGNDNLFNDEAFWVGKFTELYLAHKPFRDLDQIVGNTNTAWRIWLDRPPPDSCWDAYNPTDAEFARMNLPILTVTGYYDADQPGAMEFYKRHVRLASREARAKHYLVIGPWDHTGTMSPSTSFAGLQVDQDSQIDINSLHKSWYSWTMKGGPRPKFLKKRVTYYVPGSEVWKYADSLEAVTKDRLILHLDSIGADANDVFHSGFLKADKPGNSAPDHYVYDPMDTRFAEVDNSEGTNYITDQSDTLNLFGNGLVYHSEPFAEDTELAGFPRFTAWMAMDVPDTDFMVTLYEIMKDGTSILLTQDAMRARYHESRSEKLAVPGAVNKYDFDKFVFFARQIAKGSRLRLVLNCPNSIFYEKNYNSGGIVAQESGKDARTAHITLYHDAAHPSALELPIGK